MSWRDNASWVYIYLQIPSHSYPPLFYFKSGLNPKDCSCNSWFLDEYGRLWQEVRRWEEGRCQDIAPLFLCLGGQGLCDSIASFLMDRLAWVWAFVGWLLLLSTGNIAYFHFPSSLVVAMSFCFWLMGFLKVICSVFKFSITSSLHYIDLLQIIEVIFLVRHKLIEFLKNHYFISYLVLNYGSLCPPT